MHIPAVRLGLWCLYCAASVAAPLVVGWAGISLAWLVTWLMTWLVTWLVTCSVTCSYEMSSYILGSYVLGSYEIVAMYMSWVAMK